MNGPVKTFGRRTPTKSQQYGVPRGIAPPPPNERGAPPAYIQPAGGVVNSAATSGKRNGTAMSAYSGHTARMSKF